MKQTLIIRSLGIIALGVATLVSGETCTDPKVQTAAYTPGDAQVLTHIAFIADFKLTCSNGVTGINLYADMQGTLVPVVKAKDSPNQYQVSWTTELAAAKTGDHSVNLYDDEGYAAVKRIRERGEDPVTVKPLATVTVSYPGAYKGPWVKSEFLALVLATLVFYLAYSSKSALLA